MINLLKADTLLRALSSGWMVPENIQTPTTEGILLKNPHPLDFQLMQRQLQLFKKLANSVT